MAFVNATHARRSPWIKSFQVSVRIGMTWPYVVILYHCHRVLQDASLYGVAVLTTQSDLTSVWFYFWLKSCVCAVSVCVLKRALHRKNVCHFSTLYDRNICLFWWSYVAPMAVGRNGRIVSSFRYNAPKPMECCCSLQKLPHKHITFHNNKAHIVFLLHTFFLAMRTNVCWRWVRRSERDGEEKKNYEKSRQNIRVASTCAFAACLAVFLINDDDGRVATLKNWRIDKCRRKAKHYNTTKYNKRLCATAMHLQAQAFRPPNDEGK